MKKIVSIVIVIITIFVFNNCVYAYQEYSIGDIVKYNDIDFYVIKNSSSEEDYVTLLKAEPLTEEEINYYGIGHVNKYTSSSVGTAYIENGYAMMAYYTSEKCGYIYDEYDNESHWVLDDCRTDYADSEIKYVIDAWAIDKIPSGLQEARLITKEEIDENFEFEEYDYKLCGDDCGVVIKRNRITADWMYNDYIYWTSSLNQDNIWMFFGEWASSSKVYNNSATVRPVVVLYKSAIDNDFISDDNIDDKSNKIESNEIIDNGINLNEEKQEIKETIKVPNTLKSISGLIVLVGMVLVCIGINIFIIVKNRNGRKKEDL